MPRFGLKKNEARGHNRIREDGLWGTDQIERILTMSIQNCQGVIEPLYQEITTQNGNRMGLMSVGLEEGFLPPAGWYLKSFNGIKPYPSGR